MHFHVDERNIWAVTIVSQLATIHTLFFCLSEMAEHHNIKQILPLARDLVCKVQMLIENKWLCCSSSFLPKSSMNGCSSTRVKNTRSDRHTYTLHKAFTITVCCYEPHLLYPLCYLCCQQWYENITLNICQYVQLKTNVTENLLHFEIFSSDIP